MSQIIGILSQTIESHCMYYTILGSSTHKAPLVVANGHYVLWLADLPRRSQEKARSSVGSATSGRFNLSSVSLGMVADNVLYDLTDF